MLIPKELSFWLLGWFIFKLSEVQNALSVTLGGKLNIEVELNCMRPLFAKANWSALK